MIKRNLFEDLKQHCAQKEISLLVGPRQAGKTTLMLMLRDYLLTQGSNTLFLSLDFDSDQPFFTSQRNLVNKIQLEIGKSKGYVFIDEIQRRDDAGLFLKGLYDLNLPYKFIVSGSIPYLSPSLSTTKQTTTTKIPLIHFSLWRKTEQGNCLWSISILVGIPAYC
jgi:predicted AAA+ superfamily ATPase